MKYFRLIRAIAITLLGVSQVPVTIVEAFTSVLSEPRVVALYSYVIYNVTKE